MGTKTLEQTDFKTYKAEESRESMVSLIRSFGYPVEVFRNIETEDKYLLDIYRIPHGKTNSGNGSKPVVLMLHGLMTSCADYIVMGPGRSLAFILADRGYDIWLGNARGSKFARKHSYLNPDIDRKYWNFSFHEIGVYDLPAMITFIQATTRCRTLSCVATSQGTTSFFVLLSEKPQYNKLINVLICMAPVHKVTNLSGPLLKFMARNSVVWQPLVNTMGWTSFPPQFLIRLFNYFAAFCYSMGLTRRILAHIMFILCGYDYEQLDMSDIPAILSHIPNSTSMNHITHFCQSLITDEFKRIDYGPQENLNRYRQTSPPFYDLSKTVCPVALFYSNGGDWISSHLDVYDLKQKLPNVIMDHVIDYPKFNHLDFAFAKDVVHLLYRHIYPILDKYSFEQ